MLTNQKLEQGLGINFIEGISMTIISDLKKKCQDRFGENLLSLVLFGSIVRGGATEGSDIDGLVIVKGLEKDWRARDKITLELEELGFRYEKTIHLTLVGEKDMDLSINFGSPLMFEIYDANEVIFDKNNFFEKSMAKFEKNMKKWKAKKTAYGEWDVPGLAVISSGT
ncbi:MAG: nucleotidyltransferase domain-containing protein [Methanosarcinales archaeon Met12]|nr:MAG: nucleotidyltransferase domain-containing protein [Methanosarcinales archaeon Met12]